MEGGRRDYSFLLSLFYLPPSTFHLLLHNTMDKQRLLIAFFALILIGGVYFYYYVYTIAPSVEVMNPEIRELDSGLAAIRPLNSVELNTSILDNPFFRSLKPLVTPATPEVITAGRANPFLPF